jgi:hypothetical protein
MMILSIMKILKAELGVVDNNAENKTKYSKLNGKTFRKDHPKTNIGANLLIIKQNSGKYQRIQPEVGRNSSTPCN